MSRSKRPTRQATPLHYVAAAVLVTLVTGSSIVWLQKYSDRESLVETTLSRLQANAYHLGTIEERAHANKRFGVQASSEFRNVVLDSDRQIAVIRLNGEPDTASSLARNQTRLVAALKSEFALINKRRSGKMVVHAGESVDAQFNSINRQIEIDEAIASERSDNSNLIAIIGTIVLLLSAAGLAGILFRRYARSQQSITQLATQQATLELSERRLHSLVRNASDLIVIVSPDSIVNSVVAASEQVWAHNQEALLNFPMFDLVARQDVTSLREILDIVSQTDGGIVHGELQIKHGDGSYRPAEIIATNLLSEPGIEGIVLNCRDISERKSAEAKMSHLAFHDPLTDLPNRTLFMERLTHALSRVKRSQYKMAVIFLDLDNFKVVNDSLGHEAGDTLLKTVASRLSALIRPGDTVARLGGDEFTMLLEDINSDAEAIAVTERISEVLAMSVPIEQREIFVNASMGIALNSGDEASADDLLRDADTAMYQAKMQGKGHSVVFDTNMNVRAIERLEIETDLHNALERDELRVFYQPIMSLDSGVIREVEALVRWQHPTRGLILPGVFIPIAEDSGLIVPLGEWILEKACSQIVAWQGSSPNNTSLTVSVNLSVRQLHESDLVSKVSQILERVGMDPRNLKLEVTESVMLRDPANVTEKLEALKALGIRISVDDFGTGYSSMSYLSGLPIDTLKIDRSFISKMGESESDEAIVRAIVTLAKALDLRITAEGIETVEQLQRLQSFDCDQGQGFLYSRPLSVTDMTSLLDGDTLAAHVVAHGDGHLRLAA